MKNPVHIILKICIFVGLMFLLRKFNSIEPFGPHEFNDESMYYTVYDKAAASAPLKFPTKYFLNLNLFTEKVKDANLISKIKNEPVNGMLEEDFSNIFYTPNNFTIKRPKMISELNLEDFDNKGAERKRGVLVKFFEGTEWNVYKIDFEEYIVLIS